MDQPTTLTPVITLQHNSPISAGDLHYGVIDKKGILYMAGQNRWGRLGFISDQDVIENPTPVPIGPVGTKIVSVSCSNFTTIVVTEGGQVYGTGRLKLNLDAQTHHVKTFQRMNILEEVSKVSHSLDNHLFLLKNGSVRMFGSFQVALSDDYQPKYANIRVSKIIDIKTLDISVTVGQVSRPIGSTTLVYPVERYAIIDANHKLYYWGTWFGTRRPDLNEEQEEQAYDGGYIDMITEFKGLTVNYGTGRVVIQPKLIPIPEPVKQVALGLNHMLILSTTGNVYVMGEDHAGQLGLGRNEEPGNRVVTIPIKLPIPKPISFISAGRYTSAAITEDGQLYIWGLNDEIIPDLDQQLGTLRKLIYRKDQYTDEIFILRPTQIVFDIPGRSQFGARVDPNIYKVAYIALGQEYGIAVTKDGYLNFFADDYVFG